MFAFISSSAFQSVCYLGQWSAVLINFPNTGALRQSGNPNRTVGNGHSNNNNNTKSNLNYALKRLGQNNPQNKHTLGGGEAAGDEMQGGELHRLCVEVFIPDGGICGVKSDNSVYFGKLVYVRGSGSCYY